MDLRGMPSGGDPRRTDLPEFNRLMDLMESLYAGRVDVPPVLEALDQVDRALGHVQAGFLDSLPFREDSPLLDEVIPALDERFSLLRKGLPRLRAAAEEGDEASGRAALEEAREAVQGACRALARLREHDEAAGTLSESRPVHELLRVGRSYLRGRLPLESFRLRAASFAEHLRLLREGLSLLEPSPRERAVVEESRAAMQAALERQEQALQGLDLFFQDHDESRVAPALEAVREATEVLVALQRRFAEAAEREEESPCPRCGSSNPLAERYCRACGGLIPRMAPEEPAEASRLDLLDSGGAARPQFERVARLEEAIRAFAEGALPGGEVAALLDDMDARVRHSEVRFRRLEEPPPETPPDQRETLRAARTSFSEGMAMMREGLGHLRRYLECGDPLVGDLGLETVRSAGDQMAYVERLFEEAVARAG